MILVLLGTQDKPFIRLLKQVEELKKDKTIDDEIIIQAGHTKYNTDCMKLIDFVSFDEMQKLIKDADLVITHGGVASIVDSIKLNKRIIAVPRLKKFGEHVNDHQLQIVNNLAKQGYIIPLYENDSLKEAIIRTENLHIKPFKSNTNNLVKIIDTYIRNDN